MKPINLLYTIDNLLIGGAQELVKTLANNLNRERFKVSICSLIDYPEKSHNEPLTQEIEREGIEILFHSEDGYQKDRSHKGGPKYYWELHGGQDRQE